MPAGRPRSISLQPHEMEALGKEMIQWVSQYDPMHLSQWYCLHKGYTDAEWETMHVAPEFFPYYEQALKLVGLKYLSKESPIEPALKQRWQRVYFKDLRKEEDETANAEAARRANALKTEAKAIEEEKQKVLHELKRQKRTPK